MGDIPFDAVVTLFVFLVGVPAVVLQTLPPETRQVIAKRPGELLVDAAIPFAGAFGVLILGGVAGWFGAWNGEAGWSLVLATTLGIGIASAVRVVRKYGRREAVVQRLEQEAAKPLASEGRLSEDALHDLVEFGKQSVAGREREWTLQSLQSLTERTCRHPSYSGDRLEDLLVGLIEIVIAEPGAPNHQNFATAVTLLRRVMRELDREPDERFKQADALHAIYGMSRLGRASLRLENEAVPLRMLQALGVTGKRHPQTSIAVSQVLFEMAVAAVDADEILIAMSALGLLTTLVEQSAPAKGELVADTLGLLAHFFTVGEAGREFASERLLRLAPHLATGLDGGLDATYEHCTHRALFRTADKVREVQRGLAAGGAA